MKKIAFLNDGIYDYAFQSERATWATGGAERQQWLLARALASAGWTVTVGVRRPELRRQKAACQDDVRFVDIGENHVLAAWHDFFKSEQPDWWFWQCASHLFGFGVALAHLAGVKTIFGAGVDRDVRVREALYQRPRWWPMYAFGLSRTDRIVLQHSGQQSDLPRRWSGKAYVVPNIVSDGDPILPRAHRLPTVAWIAALRVTKRPDKLIEIARLLPHIQFVVCGGPSTYMTPLGYGDRTIEAFQTTPNINYRGQVSPAEAVHIVRESSLLLSTSDEEGFPQTFLEAWSHGTPVVTLGIDPGGVIRGNGLGAVCEGIDTVVAAIENLVSDREVWEKASTNARKYVNRSHSPEAAIAAMECAVLGLDSKRSLGRTPTRVSV
jgi:glycosyltransferase involved in cell wall biosynthesis